MQANSNFQNLAETYLFAEVGARVRKYQTEHPDTPVIRMDIGDVTLPLAPAVAEAMNKAVGDMRNAATFHGYGPEQGYAFLREAIARHDYKARGIDISEDEIFVSDGAKCDIANMTDLFAEDTIVGVPNPVYPVYVDSNIMAGRTEANGKIVYIKCDSTNAYKPLVPEGKKIDVIYLCSPNNPTGSVLSKADLKAWVDYARANGSLILFDSAYEAFVSDPKLPRSIYEVEGAKEVAIEVRSYSKTAGFTGLRCGYTVVPAALKARYADGSEVELRKLWLRRQTTKFNGASYVTQRGAEAIYSPEGEEQVKANIAYYLRNARMLREAMDKMGLQAIGGDNSPYVWVKAPDGLGSWELFDLLLQKCHLSTTPGVGFGSGGEGCIRLTGFNSYENTLKAIERLAGLDL